MNHNRNGYLVPLILGWVIVVLGGCGIAVSDVGSEGVPGVIVIMSVGLACFLTAIVVLIAERWPR
ncbi:hypothetical protein SAMN05421811_104275 [Nonomuraea wenchangensis]|uniref:Lipoprotein n=1 Tax=Nonomuraea wenchangensis TaxID=568860 RepID=A0A1I0HEM9_9ACTN|nr:hypothetical protein SAMN05421811_104275 [Nonomuraea wenchangensis]